MKWNVYMKLFNIISPMMLSKQKVLKKTSLIIKKIFPLPNWSTEDKELEMKIFHDCSSLYRKQTLTRPGMGLNSGPHTFQHSGNLTNAPLSLIWITTLWNQPVWVWCLMPNCNGYYWPKSSTRLLMFDDPIKFWSTIVIWWIPFQDIWRRLYVHQNRKKGSL